MTSGAETRGESYHPPSAIYLKATGTPQSPPRMYKDELVPTMAKALDPFRRLMEDFAKGSLDAYFDSVSPKEKTQTLEAVEWADYLSKLSTDPNLLLHELGQHAYQTKLENLFLKKTTVYVVSPVLLSTNFLTVQAPIQRIWLRKNSPFA